MSVWIRRGGRSRPLQPTLPPSLDDDARAAQQVAGRRGRRLQLAQDRDAAPRVRRRAPEPLLWEERLSTGGRP